MNLTLARRAFTGFILFLCLCISTFAQSSFGGQPLSWELDARNGLSERPLPTRELQGFDLQRVKLEDQKAGGASRFAAPIPVDLALNNAGRWTMLDNGDRIWRLKLHSQGALGLIALYDDIYLPKGAQFFVYSADKTQVLGAYTAESLNGRRSFLTGPVKGETAILELYEPASARGQSRLHLFRVDHAYHKERLESNYEFRLHGSSMNRGFDTSLSCNINVNCDTGSEWQREKKGIVRIMLVVAEGTGWCSGSLVNNTRQDRKPYVLSAFHCDDGYTPLHNFWRFDFNYEGNSCNNPLSEPPFTSVLGCTLRAGKRESDFQLLEMSQLPTGGEIYFNGWNRSAATTPSKGTMIHHPSGDIKKISHDRDQLEIFSGSIQWLENNVTTPANHHFKAVLDEGTFEVGSSGSPLFDENKRIVGQLNGGNANCLLSFIAYYGRLAMSWNNGANASQRLRDWLDPDNTGVEVLDGLDGAVAGILLTVSGSVTTQGGKALPGVVISYGGSSVTTDASGKYSIQLPPGNHVFDLAKTDGKYSDALSLTDVVMISQHALGKITIESPFQLLAADINKSNSITVTDVVMVSQLLLNKITAFPNTAQWRFFMNINSQVAEIDKTSLNFKIGQKVELNFTGVKVGDVNESW